MIYIYILGINRIVIECYVWLIDKIWPKIKKKKKDHLTNSKWLLWNLILSKIDTHVYFKAKNMKIEEISKD